MDDHNLLKRTWRLLRSPSSRWSLGGLLLVGGLGGVILWGGFNTVMEMTNTMQFCTSCHEMRDYVYQEYTKTVHFQNRSGVQATCSDCHVPREWGAKVVRKVKASTELWTSCSAPSTPPRSSRSTARRWPRASGAR